MRRFDGVRLRAAMDAELQRRGVCAESAHHVAASLVETSLRGVDSHGINLFPYYISAVAGGRINRVPAFAILNRRAAAATLDADHGFGHHAGSAAVELATAMADSAGIAAVGVTRSTHFGAAAYFAQSAARRGYAAFAFTNADALVKAFGAREAFFGTNPICFCAPMDGEEPFCLDMATSRVAWNKIMNRRRTAEPLPGGWAADANGNPTTSAADARMLEPTGEYKGYGLGMMVSLLCAGLAGGPFDKDILAMYGTPLDEHRDVSHFFMAIDIGAFTDRAAFGRRLTDLATRIRALVPSAEDAVMVPGDPEKRAFAVRSRQGIPVDDEKFQEFVRISPVFEEVAAG